jgi:glycosyltransferase involved in cell wall biosynthesis
MKICIAVSAFSRTGVPLAQLRFARALAEKGHEIDFLIGGIDIRHPETECPVVPGVNVITLGQAKIRNMIFPLCSYLKKAKPDVVFSAEDHFNGAFLLAAIATGSKAKISGSSRVPPSDSYSNAILSKRWFNKQLMRAVMWRADALTCVSKDMVDDYRHYFGRSAPHVGVYNIIVDKVSLLRMREPLDDPWFNDRSSPLLVAAGTLTTRKGFADLIRAMKELSNTKKARLVILGEGPLRSELQSLIDELGLSDSVRLHGLVDNPLKYYARSDIFALSSYAEGLPNVLVEAMMCGCTPVATDCRTGPREVFDGGKYGYLAPVGDPVALAGAIAAAIDRPIPADMLAEAIKPFFQDAVIQRHFEVLGLSEPKPVIASA